MKVARPEGTKCFIATLNSSQNAAPEAILDAAATVSSSMTMTMKVYVRSCSSSNRNEYHRISLNRSPRPLLVQLRQTPGLYSRPGFYLHIHITAN